MSAVSATRSDLTVGILSHFYPPDIGGIPRLHSYTVQHYGQLGVRPVVVTQRSRTAGRVDNVYRVAEYSQVFETARAIRQRDSGLPASQLQSRVDAAADKAAELFAHHGVSVINSHVYTDLRIGMQVADRLNVPHVHIGHSAYRSDTFLQSEAERLGTDAAMQFQEEIKRTLQTARVSRYVVHTEYLRSKYISLGVPADRIEIAPPGVDLTTFRYNRAGAAWARARLGISADEILITCPTLRKHGFDFLLHAFARLHKRMYRPVRLLCCDTAALPAEHDKLASSLGVDHLVLCSSIPAATMRDVYSASDVVVLCSTEEGIGLPVLEARACRTPVVAHRFGPFLELVQDPRDGLLVDIGDVHGMVDALERAATDPGVRNRLISAGLDAVRAYTHTRMAPRYVEIFRNAVEDSRAGTDPGRSRSTPLPATARDR